MCRLGKDGTIHPLVQYNNYIKFKPKVMDRTRNFR